MSFELSSLGKELKKKLEGGGKNKKYGIIYTPGKNKTSTGEESM